MSFKNGQIEGKGKDLLIQANSPALMETCMMAIGLRVLRMEKARFTINLELNMWENSKRAKDTDEANISGLILRSTTKENSSMDSVTVMAFTSRPRAQYFQGNSRMATPMAGH